MIANLWLYILLYTPVRYLYFKCVGEMVKQRLIFQLGLWIPKVLYRLVTQDRHYVQDSVWKIPYLSSKKKLYNAEHT